MWWIVRVDYTMMYSMWDPDGTGTLMVMQLLVWLCHSDLLLLTESCDVINEKFLEAV
jgi:hypothetical protein